METAMGKLYCDIYNKFKHTITTVKSSDTVDYQPLTFHYTEIFIPRSAYFQYWSLAAFGGFFLQ